MKRYVLDSCVFVKMLAQEDNSQKAREFILNSLENEDEIIVPEIFFYEIYSICQKQNIEFTSAFDIIDNIDVLVSINPFNSRYLPQIEEITKEGHAKSGYPSFYDSVYHAIAIIEDIDFITADKKHYEKTKHLGHIKLFSDI